MAQKEKAFGQGEMEMIDKRPLLGAALESLSIAFGELQLVAGELEYLAQCFEAIRHDVDTGYEYGDIVDNIDLLTEMVAQIDAVRNQLYSIKGMGLKINL